QIVHSLWACSTSAQCELHISLRMTPKTAGRGPEPCTTWHRRSKSTAGRCSTWAHSPCALRRSGRYLAGCFEPSALLISILTQTQYLERSAKWRIASLPILTATSYLRRPV